MLQEKCGKNTDEFSEVAVYTLQFERRRVTNAFLTAEVW